MRLAPRTNHYPWMQFYPSDWRSDNGVALCSAESRGVWIEMLCAMWDNEPRGVLPGDVRSLSKLTRCEAEEVERSVSELESHGVFSRGADVADTLSLDAIVNRRMYRDWHVRHVRSEAGKLGGRPKTSEKQNESKVQAKQKQNESKISDTSATDSTSSDIDAKANPKQRSEDLQNQKSEVICQNTKTPLYPPADGGTANELPGMPPAPLTNPPTATPRRTPKPRKRDCDPDPLFDAFWAAYPKGEAWGAAREAWDRIPGMTPDLAATITAAIVAQTKAKGIKWTDAGGKYCPLASTWLNQRRWQDDLRHLRPKDGVHIDTTEEDVPF